MGRKNPIETTYTVPNCPATFALLADSHNTNPAPILRSLRTHSPALILIAGDFVYGSTPLESGRLKMEESSNALDLIAGCAAIAPTYLSLGNHEWMLHRADLDLISSTGAIILDNCWAATVVNGKRIILGGLSSSRYTHYQSWCVENPSSELYPRETYHVAPPIQPDLSWLPNFTSVSGYHVLISHHPEYYHLLRDRGIDMILSGHAHGGQWRFFGHGLFAPGQGLLPALTSGVVDGKLVISRGLSNTTVIPRISNRPEIVYVE